AYALAGVLAGLARIHADLVGNDKCRIEADAELADERSILLLVASEFAEELTGTRLGDGAEVVDRIFAIQADAVIADGDGASLLVEAHADLQLAVVLVQRTVVDGLETQLVTSVRSVGNQLA